MKRSTRLVRRTPLKASAPLKRKRARRIDRETPAEKAHKRLVRRMTWCAARGIGSCEGALQAAHLGHSGGTGRQHGTQEDTAMLCRYHHDQFDGRSRGALRDMGGDKWCLAAPWIQRARAFVAHCLAAEESPF